MKNFILFGLLAASAFAVCGQDAQAGCYYRRSYGCCRTYCAPRCYTPVCGVSTCYTPRFFSPCYAAPCVNNSCATINPIVNPVINPVVTTAPTCTTWAVAGMPQIPQVYCANR